MRCRTPSLLITVVCLAASWSSPASAQRSTLPMQAYPRAESPRVGTPMSSAQAPLGFPVEGERNHDVRNGMLIGGVAALLLVGQDMLRNPQQCRGSGNYGQVCAAILTGSTLGGVAVGAAIGFLVRRSRAAATSKAAR